MSELGFAELISKIAHELRSPLTAVQGFSGTLVKRWDRFDDEQRKQLVETIHADAVRMGRIITEVLDLARIESGRLELSLSDVSLAAIAEKVSQRMVNLPGAERLSIEIEDDLTLWGDAARVENVVANLVENAIKFSDDGPVSLRASDSDPSWVEVVVEDEGPGIEPERMSSLFSGPAPSGQSSGPLGSGLGLYLTKRLVDAHGGTIDVDSSPGRGTRFIVRLPASEERS